MASFDRFNWAGDWSSGPIWPHEPDVNIVRLLANEHLAAEVPPSINKYLVEVEFFAEGRFNKLYKISYPRHRKSYIFRVTLPIVPYYKTESEVATSLYVRANTSIPVPKIFAWNSDRNNKLRYEWILMEKMDGVPLDRIWRKLPWESKLDLTETMAKKLNELHQCRFRNIGALYLSPSNCRTGTYRNTQDSQLSLTSSAGASGKRLDDNVAKGEFYIGPIFDPAFFMVSRPYLPGSRGPYRSSLEWLSEEIQVQLEWIKNGPTQDDPDYTSDFEEESTRMLSRCNKNLKTMQTIFSDKGRRDSFVLHHREIDATDILVHPDTFEITGIVDWELINVVPQWSASEYPLFLTYADPEEEKEPPIPSYEDEYSLDVIRRDNWEYRILRRHFDEAMQRSTEDGILNADTTEIKDI